MAIAEPDSPPSESSDCTVCTIVFGRSTLVGRSLADALSKSKRWNVRIVDPLPPPADTAGSDLLPDAASYHHVDVSDLSSLRSAVAGSADVFLVDPLPWPATADEDFPRLHSLAAIGTKNLISACHDSGVRRLIYSGSATVVADGKIDIRDADESLPYPHRYEDFLNELRMQVEIMILSASGKGGLLTCALRPSNVFGPGDPNFVPFLLREARAGRAKFLVGSGRNMSDFTYVKNVVRALVSAEHALRLELASVAGKPFFITNNQPMELWEFIGITLEGLGHQRPSIRLPVKLALLLVFLAKLVQKKLGLTGLFDSSFSPAIVYFLSCTRTFNCSKAKALLGYSPTVSLEDGITLTLASFSHSAKEQSFLQGRDLPITSKADKLLGSGVVASMLLWRDERRTFACLTVLYLLFHLFVVSGRTFISSSAKILMVVTVALFVHGKLPPSVFGVKIGKISSSGFEVSETTARDIVFALAFSWNTSISTIKSLAKGEDWSIFLKASCSLILVRMLLSIPISVLIGLGITLLFSVFIVYEQCEEEVEKIGAIIFAGLPKLKEQLIARYPAILGHLQDLKDRVE